MILTAIIAGLAALAVQMAQALGNQYNNGLIVQQSIQNCIQQIGQEGLQQLFKRLGID